MHTHAGLFSMAYLNFDMLMQVFVYKDWSPLGYQNMFHHVLSMSCFVMTTIAGRHLPMLSQVVMICECSQIFLNVRTVIGREAKGIIASINSLCFVISYTLFRVIFFPLILYSHIIAINYYFDLSKETFIRRMCHYIVWVVFFGVFILNCYWYQFVLRGILKMFETKPKDKKVKPTKKDK